MKKIILQSILLNAIKAFLCIMIRFLLKHTFFSTLLLVCFVTSNLIFSQSKVRKPDFFKIQTEVKNSASDYYLPKLLSRYNESFH